MQLPIQIVPIGDSDPTELSRTAQPVVQDLIARHGAMLRRYLRLLGCDAQLADELAHDVFVAAWQQRSRVDLTGRDRPIQPYLRAMARNQFVTRLRRDARREVLELELEAAERVWVAECAHDDGRGYFDAVRECLRGLTPRARRAVEAAHVEELPRAQICAELRVGQNGLKSLLSRALATLRDCVARRTRT